MAHTRHGNAMKILLEQGRSRLGGINEGKFPRHHFTFVTDTMPEGWPLWIDFGGWDEWRRGCYRFREWSNTFSVELVTAGCFRFIQSGKEYLVREGEIFLVQLEQDSSMECAGCEEARKRTIAITGPLLMPYLQQSGLGHADVLRPTDPGRFHQVFDRIDEILAGGDPNKGVRVAQLSFELLLLLTEENRQSRQPEIQTKIVRYIDGHLGERITLGRLSREFGLSPATILRLFHRHLGETPINYLIRRRMETARRLLRLTAWPIKKIAFLAGYSNSLYFSMEFRKHTGESPSMFRRQSRGISE